MSPLGEKPEEPDIFGRMFDCRRRHYGPWIPGLEQLLFQGRFEVYLLGKRIKIHFILQRYDLKK